MYDSRISLNAWQKAIFTLAWSSGLCSFSLASSNSTACSKNATSPSAEKHEIVEREGGNAFQVSVRGKAQKRQVKRDGNKECRHSAKKIGQGLEMTRPLNGASRADKSNYATMGEEKESQLTRRGQDTNENRGIRQRGQRFRGEASPRAPQ